MAATKLILEVKKKAQVEVETKEFLLKKYSEISGVEIPRGAPLPLCIAKQAAALAYDSDSDNDTEDYSDFCLPYPLFGRERRRLDEDALDRPISSLVQCRLRRVSVDNTVVVKHSGGGDGKKGIRKSGRQKQSAAAGPSQKRRKSRRLAANPVFK